VSCSFQFMLTNAYISNPWSTQCISNHKPKERKTRAQAKYGSYQSVEDESIVSICKKCDCEPWWQQVARSHQFCTYYITLKSERCQNEEVSCCKYVNGTVRECVWSSAVFLMHSCNFTITGGKWMLTSQTTKEAAGLIISPSHLPPSCLCTRR
jgi:hypothetical protein